MWTKKLKLLSILLFFVVSTASAQLKNGTPPMLDFGVFKVERVVIAKGLFAFQDDYIKERGWGKTLSQNFRRKVGFVIDAMLDGTLESVGTDGIYHFTGHSAEHIRQIETDKNELKATQAALKYTSDMIKDYLANHKHLY